MNFAAIAEDIAALEARLGAASTPEAEALAVSIAERIAAVSPDDAPDRREVAVRGQLAASLQRYRTGHVAHAAELLRSAVQLAEGLDAALRFRALLRCGEMELLTYDVGAALGHTAAALEVARAAGRASDEAQAWVAYGMGLDWAGLYPQADAHWAHALGIAEGLGDMRLRSGIWALRCPLGFRLQASREEAAVAACREALACALETPPRVRDSMACTALCNWAALCLQRGRVAEALGHLDRAATFANVGVRDRWLVAVLRALAAVRERNATDTRAALDALLAPERAPAAIYVIETTAVMAAMYADMGDAGRATESLERLSRERARALWAVLRAPRVEGTRLPEGLTAPADAAAEDATAQLVRLAVTAELRDDATGKHCFRVGRLAMLLGRRAGLAEAGLEGLEIAARLHDIGKIVIPDAILLKPGRLDATETHLMRSHSVIGADILATSALPAIEAARAIARHHHERWDGGGYPDGLAGEAIPMAARVAAIADVYDALTHDRPYKGAWSHAEAMDYVARERGAHFDPGLADLFVAMMAEASADLGAFLRDLESAATASSYVVAQASVARAMHDA